MVLTKKSKRWLAALAVVVLLIGVGIWSATSLITQYINEEGETHIGRKVHLRDLDFNPISGAFKLNDLTVYEPNQVDTFLALSQLTLNLDLWAFVSGTHHIDKVKLEGMYVSIAQNQRLFNFQDIIEKFRNKGHAEGDTSQTPAKPYDFTIKELSIVQSHVLYQDASLPFPLHFTNVEALFPEGYRTQEPEIHGQVSFVLNNAGNVGARLDYDLESQAYAAGLQIDHFDIKLIEGLVKERLHLREIQGELNTKLSLTGNLKEVEDVDLKGFVALKKAALIDLNGERIAGMGHVQVYIDLLNGFKEQYAIRKIVLTEPEGIFHLSKEGNNFQSLIKSQSDALGIPASGEKDKSVRKGFMAVIANQIVETVSSYTASNLLIDTLSIVQGHFKFEDHTAMDTFKYQVSDFAVAATELYFTKDSVPVQIDALLNGKAALHVSAFLYPDRLKDLSFQLEVTNFDMTDVSPYFYQHLGRNVLSGSLSGTHVVTVKNQQLLSTNHLSIDSMQVGPKAKHKLSARVPLKTGVAALKNRKGVIELDIPISGDLSNPNYKLGKTILGIFKNLLIKAAISPGRAITKHREKRKRKHKQ